MRITSQLFFGIEVFRISVKKVLSCNKFKCKLQVLYIDFTVENCDKLQSEVNQIKPVRFHELHMKNFRVFRRFE